MAEHEIPQDNPSMEDILSSIKGILSEDEEKHSSSQKEESDDDIFDLSSSMIIDAPTKESQEPQQESSAASDDDLPEIKLEEDIDLPSEPLFDEQPTEEPEEILHSAEQPQSLDEPIKDDAISEEQLDKLIQSIDDNNVDSVLERELPQAEPEIEHKSEAPEAVSDSIINNFAQMFSENNSEEKGAEIVSAAPTMKIGEGAQTVEDLIKAVMAESLKPAIERALVSVDKDIMELAREEVSKEAKIWVDKNLTEVVESVIREEVKRVMAKVGS